MLGFVHVDMDAFFVSCELLRRPELRTEPVVVGGTGDRGSSPLPATSPGVTASIGDALQPGPSAVPSCRVPSGDHAYYAEVSRRVMAVFADVTPYVEPLSLDEAFLMFGGPCAIAPMPPRSPETSELGSSTRKD